jgi:gliding motility-associated lipoprotein GldD
MNQRLLKFATLMVSVMFLTSCKDETIPKPAAQLSLEYEVASYFPFVNACPFTFEANQDAVIKVKSDCNLTIDYPKMKATIFLTYHPVSGNITELLRDAQKLTYEHVIKADHIIEQPYVNPRSKVYGMFYEVNGNAATNGQFYATDSTRHFIECSVYFYAKPNFDSLQPAASYVKNDMQHLLESLKWK